MKKILLFTFFIMGSIGAFSQKIKIESIPGTQIVDYAQTPEQAKERVFPMGYTEMMKAKLEADKKLAANTRKSSSQASNFQVFYEQGSNLSTEVKAIFEKAAATWANALNSDVPIKILVRWRSLATGVLGSAGASTYYRNFPGAAKAGTWYPIALAEKMARKDLNGEDQADIVATFNSDRTDWYTGESTPTRLQYDLYSIVLHEFGHGLGFIGTFGANETVAGWGSGSFVGSAGIFDNFIVNSTGVSLIDSTTIDNFSEALRKEITGGKLFLNSPSATKANANKQAKLYAPTTYSAGSSIYHVDQATYRIGDPNALMTPSIAAGELTRDLGPIILNFFADMGWVSSSITHDAFTDNEDTNKDYVFTAKVFGDTAIKDGSVKLYMTTSNLIADAKEVPLTKSGNQYSYTLPKSTDRRQISYYWQGEDLAGRKLATPAEAPLSTKGFTNFYRFTIGADTVKPVIAYTNNIYSIYTTDTEVKLPQGQAFDNIGIDSAYVEYYINDVKQAPILLTYTTADRTITFDGSFKFTAAQFKGNDVVKYRIVVKDKAKAHNTRFSPETGFYEFKVLKLFPAVNTYNNNFDTSPAAPEDFYLKGFTFSKPTNFTSIALNSDHPYKNGSEEVFESDGNLFSNYIAQLLRPITLRSDTAKIYFDEVVLVETGADGSVFPDRDFFDYVVVEGSKDGGKTWQWFQAGWDSNDDPEWAKAWTSLNVDKDQNSKTVGNPNLFRKREIDMLSSGDFKAGDNVLVRFRLLADPLAHGWGWTVDNLNIQGPSGKPVTPTNPTVLGNETSNDIEIAISPNPSTTGEYKIKASFAKATKNVTINVVNIFGLSVFNEQHNNSGNEFNHIINLGGVSNGTYLLKLQTENGVINKKIILAK
ncbi:T9SS type A sorting domain-containing protein [Arcicella lustrica]|uniref:T9SS type A sorting domain-containing protein n=1 Tax=Arcicella lustrica TaxID=2984196 RepID=A0ABU5SF91_9BACT|nr:T9SS type A sorting domain-containing protein [Arcicella sp. DC25W]MEA5425956.1 T9SS type A sorting domain-containing protein [Arcicella sp. DC25W]